MSKRFAICDVFAAFLLLLGASAVDCWAQDKREPDSSKGTPQKEVQGKPKDKPEAANIDSLTKLRREQKKRDPLTIEVEVPKDFHATTRNLPVLKVTLKNVDEEKKSVQMTWNGSHDRCVGLWRFEVHDSTGKPVRQPDWRANGSFVYSEGVLDYDKTAKATLNMGDDARIKEPGEYTVQVYYLDITQDHFGSSDTRDFIWSASREFKLKVGKPVPKVVEVPAGSRERAKALIAALSDEGPIRLIDGNYGPSLYKFMDPNSPEGQLHKMGRDALPGLLDALRDEKLSFHRRGWVLGMLFYLTEERDLDPFWWEKGGRITPAYEIRGMGSGSGRGGKPNLAGQREFSKECLKVAAECWDFRETKK
jgi:hypothetical protein